MAHKDDKPRYLCRVCQEDLTPRITGQLSARATQTYHILPEAPPNAAAPSVRTPPSVTTPPGSAPHRIGVTCYQNHVNIFNIFSIDA